MITYTRLTARIVLLTRFLLAANCPLLSECLSDHAEDASDASAVIILPDVSCSTLSSMLKCTLNYAVRWDTLSVNEQQVMALLGFNLEKAPIAADADAPGMQFNSLLLWMALHVIGPFMILSWQLDGVCFLILIKSALLFSDAR